MREKASSWLCRELRPAFGWDRCLYLSNRAVELVLTLDVGPRMLHWGLVGGPNELKVFSKDLGQVGGARWRIYGGHRLLTAPEKVPFAPDNAPLTMAKIAGGVRLTQPVERSTGLQKEWVLRLDPRLPRLKLAHRIVNRGRKARELAAWALTVFEPGGQVILPLPQRGTWPAKVAPAGSLTLWPYTDLGDKRWSFGPSLLRYHADKALKAPQKLGLFSPEGWLAYRRGGRLMVIQAKPKPGLPHADLGANAEVWGRHDMVELETLGPLTRLKPGQSLQHEETWSLGRLAPGPLDDKALSANIRRLAGITR